MIDEFILNVAKEYQISRLKSYSINIISNYENFFDFILPKNVTNVFIVIPLDEEITKLIRDAVIRVRGKALITIMYNLKTKDRIFIGWYPPSPSSPSKRVVVNV